MGPTLGGGCLYHLASPHLSCRQGASLFTPTIITRVLRHCPEAECQPIALPCSRPHLEFLHVNPSSCPVTVVALEFLHEPRRLPGACPHVTRSPWDRPTAWEIAMGGSTPLPSPSPGHACREEPPYSLGPSYSLGDSRGREHASPFSFALPRLQGGAALQPKTVLQPGR